MKLTVIQSFCAHPQSLCARFQQHSSKIKQTFSNTPMDTTRAPPIWLQRWKNFVVTIFSAEKILAQVMVKACRLRLRNRSWLHYQDPLHMEDKEMLFTRATGPCPHEQLQRSGNKYGRYSKCLQCGKKWTWDEDAKVWTEPKVYSKQPPLPLPSSSTATVFQDKAYTPAASMGLKTWDLTPLAIKDQPLISSTAAAKKAAAKRGAKPKKGTAKRQSQSMEEEDSDYDWSLLD